MCQGEAPVLYNTACSSMHLTVYKTTDVKTGILNNLKIPIIGKNKN